MNTSPRILLAAGLLFTAGSLAAGLVHCAQVDEASAWQQQLMQEAARKDAVKPAPQAVPAQARCPVCGMYPARYGQWAAQVHTRDGNVHYFDSPVEFLTFLRELPRYGKGLKAKDLVAGYVTDHANGGWVNAVEAHYVAGSSIKGPMGEEAFPAFSTRESAEAVVKEKGGEILAWDALVAQFAGMKRGGGHPHHGH